MSKLNRVQHNGLHYDDMDILHLVQGTESANAVGLSKDSVRFIVGDRKNKICHHHIDLFAPEPDITLYEKLKKEKVFELLAPVPTPDNVAFIWFKQDIENGGTILKRLSEVFCPTMNNVYPLWAWGQPQVKVDLERLRTNSNLITVCLTGQELQDSDRIKLIARLFSTAPAKLAIEYRLPETPTGNINLIKSNLTLADFKRLDIDVQLRRCGAKYLREFMRC